MESPCKISTVYSEKKTWPLKEVFDRAFSHVTSLISVGAKALSALINIITVS